MAAKHTPTPWFVERARSAYGVDLNVVRWETTPDGHQFPVGIAGSIGAGYVKDGTSLEEFHARVEANAEFIVRACNSHEELLEALREAAETLSSLYAEYGRSKAHIAFEHARAAIAKATGGES